MKTLSVLDTCLDLILSKDQRLKTDLTASSHCGLPCKLSSWSEAVLCFLLSYLLLSDLVVEWLNSLLFGLHFGFLAHLGLSLLFILKRCRVLSFDAPFSIMSNLICLSFLFVLQIAGNSNK